MNKGLLAYLAGLLALGMTSSVQAQQYVPPQTSPFFRPALSPYLNLALPGQAGINYYGIVRPQLAYNQSIGQLQTGQQLLNAELLANTTDATGQNTLTTGHPAVFMNYSHYYGNRIGANAAGQTQPLTTPRPGIFGAQTVPRATTPPGATPRSTTPPAVTPTN
jgi:hypothetical protein